VSTTASRRLQDIGIEICVDTAVAEVTATEVRAADGRRFPAAITVWAAGVKGPSLCAKLGVPLNRNDQILVDDRLQTIGDSNIYAMGDCSSLAHPPADAMVPPSAQAARQQAIFLADFIVKQSRQTLPAFRFRNYGTLVSFGPFGATGVLLNAIGKRSVRVRGALAQVMYAYSYRRYMMSNLGLGRMLGQWLAGWIRSRLVTPVKWH
jgi:NADH dehydrogenase